jgi:hypothetical protein
VGTSPSARAATGLLLAQGDGEDQAVVIGKQVAGRVGFFLQVEDFEAAYARMASAGVRFLTAPRTESYGRVAVFLDIAGNKWDLLGPHAQECKPVLAIGMELQKCLWDGRKGSGCDPCAGELGPERRAVMPRSGSVVVGCCQHGGRLVWRLSREGAKGGRAERLLPARSI